jgi:thiamine-monophosphate kinase
VATSSRSKASGEFALLARVRAAVQRLGRGRGVVVGIGDDCAVVESPGIRSVRKRSSRATPSMVLTTDTMVEGVHYRAGWLTPRELGVRAFRTAVSDVAAMGARPRYVLLSLEIPTGGRGLDEDGALALVRALAAEAKRCGAALVGGNVSGGARAGVTVTVVGEAAAKPLLRSDARPGDLVFVTGSLGGAAAGWRALLAQDKAAPRRRRARVAASAFRRPPLHIDFAAALAEAGLVRAMIDVSDGLLQDLGHVAEESHVAIRVDETLVPVHRDASAGRDLRAALELALGGGEDYELAFTAAPSHRAAIEKLAATHRVPVHVVGFVDEGEPAVTDTDGSPFRVTAGFDHLKKRAARATKGR